MPTPGQQAHTLQHQAHARFLDHMTGADQRPATQADVQALTEQVAELVRLLAPPSAVILTGSEVTKQFSRLSHAAR
jgi:deoxyribose-phosphate aldolase